MPISSKYKCIFLHCPKTGGTTIENIMDMNKIENLVTWKYPNNSLALQHLTYNQLKNKINPEEFNTYFKFTFVRNPWDRLVSDYCWNNRNYATFRDFVFFVRDLIKKYPGDEIFKCPQLKTHNCGHFIPQTLYIGPDVKIYRFENYTDGLNEIFKILNIQLPSIPATGTG